MKKINGSTMKTFFKINHNLFSAIINAVFYCTIGFFIGMVYTANFVTSVYHVTAIG